MRETWPLSLVTVVWSPFFSIFACSIINTTKDRFISFLKGSLNLCVSKIILCWLCLLQLWTDLNLPFSLVWHDALVGVYEENLTTYKRVFGKEGSILIPFSDNCVIVHWFNLNLPEPPFSRGLSVVLQLYCHRLCNLDSLETFVVLFITQFILHSNVRSQRVTTMGKEYWCGDKFNF